MTSKITMEKSHALYGGVGCVMLGLMVAPYISTMPQAPTSELLKQALEQCKGNHVNHEHEKMNHTPVEVTSDKIPSVKISVSKDSMSGFNLVVKTENFDFAPENINQAVQQNQGHAHIYINGEKLARLYGNHYHLSGLTSGEKEVMVTLNANNHGEFTVDGQGISDTVTITVPEMKKMNMQGMDMKKMEMPNKQ